jgi:hypothetical protein
MWGNKKVNPGGTDFETAAASVTAEVLPNPEEDPGLYEQAGDGNSNAPQDESGDRLEIRPEWAVALARSPYALVAKFYHPAFALSDDQAEKLGPKLLPLIRKVTDVWIPSWLAGVSNRNPEMTDAVFALAVTGYVQWMHVQKIQEAEREAAENAKRVKGEHTNTVTEMPLRPEPEPGKLVVGERLVDGSLVI